VGRYGIRRRSGAVSIRSRYQFRSAAGGGDQIAPSKLTAISEKRLQGIYEKTDFLPSKALGQIDAFL
jgi:hypothetical protein